jgi:outer membrane protein OmpA-like peptidoglycan-associated protein
MDMMLPDTVNGEVLFADMNVGRAAVYLVGTEQPVFAGQMISQGDPPPWVSIDEIARRLENPASGARAITRLSMLVRAPSVKEFVSAGEFVEFYTVGTRSVKNADRGFRIGFKLNSADLDEFSRRQLESVGAGMMDQRLVAQRFLIEGHTDDLGTPDYNRELSVRRAQAVRDYLTRVSGVPRQRLDIRGLGQSRPQVEGSTEQARSQNRRVVIRRLDGG